ncbi:MAG: radical SAM protein [Ruminococcus sp.]|nr:radical SAM protein [Ruminococcus sp.]
MKIALVFCRIDDAFASYPAGVFSIFESNPPLGLAAIGTVAKLRGHTVQIFDQLLYHDSNNRLLERLTAFSPDITGFSCTSLNIQNSEQCARIIKNRCGSIVFAGGIHITLCTKEVLERDVFDFLISGEGEEVFDAVLDKLEHSGNLNQMPETTGFWQRGCSLDKGIAVLNTIDQPLIDRSIMDYHAYKNKGALLDKTPCYSLFSSRGCPFSCKFCSKPDYFKQYRCRRIDQIIREIRYLINICGGKSISFREDNFTVDRKRLFHFCDAMIEAFGGKLYWECESRADMPRALLEKMYQAGCRGIWCGIETIVPRWSEWICKDLKRESVELFYRDCQEIGIATGALFMFGFPDQTEAELEEDIAFAASLPTRFSAFQCLAIFPASPLIPYYAEHPELCHRITNNVSLAMTKGKTWQEMIATEKEINQKIRSIRLSYQDGV